MNFFKKLFHTHQIYTIKEVHRKGYMITGYKIVKCRTCGKEFTELKF